MTASEVKKLFLIKSEENSTNDSISVSNDRFVEIINEAFIKIVEYFYEKKNEDDFRYIQELLMPDTELEKSNTYLDHQSFKLPEDYFEFSNIYALGSKGKCTSQKLELFEIKDLDRSIILNDEFNSPSFEYREAPFNFFNNKVRVFKKDFNIDKAVMSYYRYPKKVRLTNPKNPESQLDDSYQLDFDEKVIHRVVSLAVKEFDMNNSDERFQLNQIRTASKI